MDGAGGAGDLVRGPMTDAERKALLQVIEERRAQLAERRRAVDALVRGGGEAAAAAAAIPSSTSAQSTAAAGRGSPERVPSDRTGSPPASASDLVRSVMETIEAASRDAARRTASAVERAPTGGLEPPPAAAPEGPAAAPGAAGRGRRATQQMRYSKALKKVVNALTAQPNAISVLITPRTLDRFDKSAQAVPLEPVEEADERPADSVDVGAEVRAGGPVDVGKGRRSGEGAAGATSRDGGGAASARRRGSREAGEGREEDGFAAGDAGAASSAAAGAAGGAAVDLVPPDPLSEDEKLRLLHSDEFDAFFAEASRVLERTLGENAMFDTFAAAVAEDDGPGGGAGRGPGYGAERLRPQADAVYRDARWSENRPLTDLKSHPRFPEIFLAAHGARTTAATATDPEGCVLIWNLALPTRAEYTFLSPSPVCTALFDPHRPQVVIGGTYSGSLMVWDSRAKSRAVQRTGLTPKGHRFPVYALRAVGTEHAATLVSVDGDGRLCLWSPAMMGTPTESIELTRSGRELRPLTIDFAHDDVNSFIGGGDDAELFQVQIHGSKAGVSASFPGHAAPVTDVHWHPAGDSDDDAYGDLLISASLDWTVKLWTPKTRNAPCHSLQSFEAPVASAQWHPSNPGLIACAAGGDIHLWDLAHDDEIAGFTARVAAADDGANPLAKLAWTHKGAKLLAATAMNGVSLWTADPEMLAPRQDDLERLNIALEEIKSNSRARDVLV